MKRGEFGNVSPRISPLFEGDFFPAVAAAHELKAPLALIRQLSLLIEGDRLDAAALQRVAGQIELTAERALRLTADLTRSTRLSDTLFELEPINPMVICEDISREMEPLFHAHGKKIVVSPRQHSLLLVANRDLLRRVLINFADNALHYADEHGRIELSACALGTDRIRVSVRDYGPAIALNVWRTLQYRLKDPQPLHSRPQSSGLGLYLSRLFAEAMHGTIGVVRHRDGASFYIDMRASTQLKLL